MILNSRYILELTGTPSVSSTNNSVVNIPGIAGAGSNVAIDLDTLGTTVGGNPESCNFNVYAIRTSFLSPDYDAPVPNHNAYAGCNAGSSVNFKNIFISDFGNSTATPTVTSEYDATLGLNYCSFSVPTSCSGLKFTNSSSNYRFLNSGGDPITSSHGSTDIGGNCVFDVYATATLAYSPDYDAQNPNSNSLSGCNSGFQGNTLNSFKSIFSNTFLNSTTNPTVTSGYDSTLGLNYCHFSVPGSCSSLHFSNRFANSRFLDADGEIITSSHGVLDVGGNCVFDVYLYAGGMNTTDRDAPIPNNVTNAFYGCNVAGSGSSVKNLLNVFGNSSLSFTITPSHDSVLGLNYCAVSTQNSCSSIKFGNPLMRFVGGDNEIISSGNDVTDIPPTPGTTQGITFTCGTDSSINYSYNNFDVTLQNSCANHDQSFLLFTPQASATGDQSLGGSTNTDNSINLPFHINNIQSQNGDFYIEPFCDTDGMGRDILVSVLDNTILV
jgi:hypothetical protein